MFDGTYYKQICDTIFPQCYWRRTGLIKLQRDSTFAIYSGKVICGEWEPVENAKIRIENKVTYTDKNGYFKICIPTSEQTISKRIIIEKDGFWPIVKQSEVPGFNMGYIIRKK